MNEKRQCVDSVINQKIENLELILVDNGSPDQCPQICDEYAEKYDFIKVIHKPNGGLSSARNTGIRAATGEYPVLRDKFTTVYNLFDTASIKKSADESIPEYDREVFCIVTVGRLSAAKRITNVPQICAALKNNGVVQIT